MQNYLIKSIGIINEGTMQTGDLLIKNGRIEKVANEIRSTPAGTIEINGEGKWLFPGVIDDQVHFREPGLTHKASIATESRAAVAGGVTSFMEMPNTIPPAFTQELLEDKYRIAARDAVANFSFYMGVSNSNAEEVLKTNNKKNEVAGIKIFMGASTGDLLVNNPSTLDRIFRESELLIATHCEDERIIRQNLEKIKAEDRRLTAADHPLIRNDEACYASSLYAIQIAKKYNTRLHILHITTEKELQLFSNLVPLREKNITSEVCVHHLHFTSEDYGRLGNLIKCNPAIKAPYNREALWNALLDDRLDVIATDHAPHTLDEKNKDYTEAPAGLPLVQHPLLLMIYYYKLGRISLEKIAEKMSHAVATCFRIRERGFIREGYHADLVIVDPQEKITINKENLLYKCRWSPLEGMQFPASISHTFVNGHLVYNGEKDGKGRIDASLQGERLIFDR